MNASVKEIARGLYQISIPLSFGLDYVHTFAAIEENRVTLFDTGPDFSASHAMYEKALATFDRAIADVDRIFLTHTHVDHCGFAGRIQAISGADIYVTKSEYESVTLSLQEEGRISLIETFLRQNGTEERIIQTFCTIFNAFKSATAPFTANHFFCDNQPIKAGGRNVRVLFTPGHTIGHVCFLLPDDRLLLAGDNILPHITPNLSPDLSCPSFYPLENYIRSLTRIEDLQVAAVYPAHGEFFTNLKVRARGIKQHHARRLDMARNSVTERIQTACEISKIIFGDQLNDFDRVLAVNETYIHLAQLEKEGLIEKIMQDKKIFFKKS